MLAIAKKNKKKRIGFFLGKKKSEGLVLGVCGAGKWKNTCLWGCYFFQGASFGVYHVFVALTEYDSGNLFIKNYSSSCLWIISSSIQH